MDNREKRKAKRVEKSIEERLDDDILYTNYEGKDVFSASEIEEILGIPASIITYLFEPVSWSVLNEIGVKKKSKSKYYHERDIKDALENPKNEKHDILIKMLKEYKNKKRKAFGKN